MKHGFTLIELLIATALASILSATLIVLWQQMNQMRSRVDRYADMYQRATLVCAQLERDISGVFVPVEADMTQTEAGKSESDSNNEDARKNAASTQKSPASAQEGPKKLDKVFWGDHGLTLLTFVTNNIMSRYWSVKLAQTTQAQPRMARVIYKLEPEKNKKDSFMLMRQESPEIYFDVMQQKGAPTYALATGIKAIRLEYVVYVKIPAEKKGMATAAPQQTPQEVFEKKIVKEWHKIEDNKPPWPLVPQWVLVDLELWDSAHTRTQTFHFEIQILPRFDKKEQSSAPRAPAISAPQQARPDVNAAGGVSPMRTTGFSMPTVSNSRGAYTTTKEIITMPIMPDAGIIAYGVR